jgi:tetratricopeptide (TPR) repeat protein
MADVLLKMSRVKEAEEHLKMAVAADPHYLIARSNLALIYMLQGEEQKAVQELRAILAVTPDYLPALLALGGLYELQGASGDALEYFRRARGTGRAGGYRALALYLLRTGAKEEAAQVLEEGVRSNSTSPELYDVQAKLFASMGNYEASVKALEGLRRVDPERGLAALITLDMSFGKSDSALRRVQKELSREPDNERMLREAAQIYSHMGDAMKALELAERMISLNPAAPDGYLAVADVYLRARDLGKARETIETAPPAVQQNERIHVIRGDIYSAEGKHDAALTAYRKAESVRPGFLHATFKRAVLLHSLGRTDEAIQAYWTVLGLSMNHVGALNNLAYIYAEMEQGRRAVQLARRAYIVAPESFYVLDTLGYALLKDGKFTEAEAILLRAAHMAPNNPSVQYHLALAEMRVGKRERAERTVAKALRVKEFPEREEAESLLEELHRGL